MLSVTRDHLPRICFSRTCIYVISISPNPMSNPLSIKKNRSPFYLHSQFNFFISSHDLNFVNRTSNVKALVSNVSLIPNLIFNPLSLTSKSSPFFLHSQFTYSIPLYNSNSITSQSKKSHTSQVIQKYEHISFYHTYSKYLPKSVKRRINKRLRLAMRPVLDESKFKRAQSKLPPRFTSIDLHNVIALVHDPLVCLELFKWASENPRFRHDVNTYHVTIKKLGAAKMYEEMDGIVNEVLANPGIGSEALFNTIIYFFTQDRKLTKAVNVFTYMRDSKDENSRPSIRTYNLLFSAFLSRGFNTYVNHMYMETIRCLFTQMVNDGVEPDIFSLNSMIKGYVLSLHLNDALRIFHQMGVVYKCLPNSFSYDYLVHGLCAQGRTKNARDLFDEMKTKGFVPSNKSYNSLVNSLALGGEVDEALSLLWEMGESQRYADFITFQTVLEEMFRRRGYGDAKLLLKKLRGEKLLDDQAYKKLMIKLDENRRELN